MWSWRKAECYAHCLSCTERHITCNATEELKLDGYRRSRRSKTGGRSASSSRSPQRQGFQRSLPGRRESAGANMPDDTVIDGEIVALDEAGRPSFSTLQTRSGFTPASRGPPGPPHPIEP